MKYLIYSDVHISQGSSIVKQEGIKYSVRLEHIIDSINWAEELAEKERELAEKERELAEALKLIEELKKNKDK